MREKPSEWVAISDLMAGVMAVVMLLLVVSELQKSLAEAKHQQEMAQSKNSKEEKVNEIMSELQDSLKDAIASGMVGLDRDARKITLRDGVFNRGSACVTDQSRLAFSTIRTRLASFLDKVPGARIYVEGHTDNRPVAQPVTDFARNCTVYDDNYTLSAARAREARKLLTSELDEAGSRRIVVAGFGDSLPIAGIPLDDARQRRIEVRLVVQDE